MKKTKASDPFEFDTCIKGMGVFIIHNYSHIFDFCYFLTFKKSLKIMSTEFNDPDEKPIMDLDFFADVDDPIVKNAYEAGVLLTNYFESFRLRYNIDPVSIFQDEQSAEQAKRYAPTYMYMIRKSYLKLSLGYQHYLSALTMSFTSMPVR